MKTTTYDPEDRAITALLSGHATFRLGGGLMRMTTTTDRKAALDGLRDRMERVDTPKGMLLMFHPKNWRRKPDVIPTDWMKGEDMAKGMPR